MKLSKKFKETALDGLVSNPVFVLALGLCPLIPTSDTLEKAFIMGLATLFVVVMSNILISIFRKLIPQRVRIPIYIMIIAVLVTIVDMVIAKFMPTLYPQVGKFINLIVVNCIIFARAESFASSNKPGYAALDGLSTGVGFFMAICLLAAVRQVLVLAGFSIFGQASGGFIVLGVLMAVFNYIYKNVMERIEIKKKLLKSSDGKLLSKEVLS
jgi:electron transport complex protein RnfE